MRPDPSKSYQRDKQSVFGLCDFPVSNICKRTSCITTIFGRLHKACRSGGDVYRLALSADMRIITVTA